MIEEKEGGSIAECLGGKKASTSRLYLPPLLSTFSNVSLTDWLASLTSYYDDSHPPKPRNPHRRNLNRLRRRLVHHVSTLPLSPPSSLHVASNIQLSFARARTTVRLEKQCQTQLLADAAAARTGVAPIPIDEPQARFTAKEIGTEAAGRFQASVSDLV